MPRIPHESTSTFPRKTVGLILLVVLCAVWMSIALSQAYGRGRQAFAAGDLGTARFWYGIAARRGDARAQTNLAGLYVEGRGGPRDLPAAARWYRAAAQQGVVQAKFNLSNLYEEGAGVPRSARVAATWLESAAADGDVDSMFNLGVLYASGRDDLPVDAARAVHWYRRAADKGHASAQYNLAGMYAQGTGVPQSYADARRWLTRAADQRHAKAWMDLGTLQAEGEGSFDRNLAGGLQQLHRARQLDPALAPEVGRRIRLLCAQVAAGTTEPPDCLS